MQFSAHKVNTKKEILSQEGQKPMIFITPDALMHMQHYVDIASKEVGWMGTCTRDGMDFTIGEVFLLKQEVHATETEISAQDMSDFFMELLDSDRDDVANAIRFWGHSHVNMGTSPSGTDIAQMKIFRDEGVEDFFVRGICNKAGRMEFSIYIYEEDVAYHDVEWHVCESDAERALREQIKAEFDEKVVEVTPAPVQYAGYKGNIRPICKDVQGVDCDDNAFSDFVFITKENRLPLLRAYREGRDAPDDDLTVYPEGMSSPEDKLLVDAAYALGQRDSDRGGLENFYELDGEMVAYIFPDGQADLDIGVAQ